MIKISEIDDKRIELYKSLKTTSNSNNENQIFIADSQKVVIKLLESNLDIISIFAVQEFYNDYEYLIRNKQIQSNQLYLATIELMNYIVGFKLHKGILAIAKIPKLSTLEELDQSIVMMNKIVDSENVGSIIRNAVAFDFKSLIFDNPTSNPYLRRSVRVSMGNIFDMKLFKSHSLKDTINDLKNFGYTILSAEINNKSKPVHQFKPKNKTAVIFGNEGKGIDNDILDLSDEILHIPINSSTQSINVAASSGIFFHYLKNHKNFNK